MPETERQHPFHDPLEALQRLLSHFDNQGVIIGGVAATLLGQPRFTEGVEPRIPDAQELWEDIAIWL